MKTNATTRLTSIPAAANLEASVTKKEVNLSLDVAKKGKLQQQTRWSSIKGKNIAIFAGTVLAGVGTAIGVYTAYASLSTGKQFPKPPTLGPSPSPTPWQASPAPSPDIARGADRNTSVIREVKVSLNLTDNHHTEFSQSVSYGLGIVLLVGIAAAVVCCKRFKKKTAIDKRIELTVKAEKRKINDHNSSGSDASTTSKEDKSAAETCTALAMKGVFGNSPDAKKMPIYVNQTLRFGHGLEYLPTSSIFDALSASCPLPKQLQDEDLRHLRFGPHPIRRLTKATDPSSQGIPSTARWEKELEKTEKEQPKEPSEESPQADKKMSLPFGDISSSNGEEDELPNISDMSSDGEEEDNLPASRNSKSFSTEERKTSRSPSPERKEEEKALFFEDAPASAHSTLMTCMSASAAASPVKVRQEPNSVSTQVVALRDVKELINEKYRLTMKHMLRIANHYKQVDVCTELEKKFLNLIDLLQPKRTFGEDQVVFPLVIEQLREILTSKEYQEELSKQRKEEHPVVKVMLEMCRAMHEDSYLAPLCQGGVDKEAIAKVLMHGEPFLQPSFVLGTMIIGKRPVNLLNMGAPVCIGQDGILMLKPEFEAYIQALDRQNQDNGETRVVVAGTHDKQQPYKPMRRHLYINMPTDVPYASKDKLIQLPKEPKAMDIGGTSEIQKKFLEEVTSYRNVKKLYDRLIAGLGKEDKKTLDNALELYHVEKKAYEAIPSWDGSEKLKAKEFSLADLAAYTKWQNVQNSYGRLNDLLQQLKDKFPNAFEVVTLPRNSSFYKQMDQKGNPLGDQNIKNFEADLYYEIVKTLPPTWRQDKKFDEGIVWLMKLVENIAAEGKTIMVEGKPVVMVTREGKQKIIDLFYSYLAVFLIHYTQSSSMNVSSKDIMDPMCNFNSIIWKYFQSMNRATRINDSKVIDLISNSLSHINDTVAADELENDEGCVDSFSRLDVVWKFMEDSQYLMRRTGFSEPVFVRNQIIELRSLLPPQNLIHLRSGES